MGGGNKAASSPPHSPPKVLLLVRSSSRVDVLDAFVLGVKWGFQVGLRLVRHSHPLQGKLPALYEIVVHLLKREIGRKRREGRQIKLPGEETAAEEKSDDQLICTLLVKICTLTVCQTISRSWNLTEENS